MFEKHVCPICWAFQNPETGECLVCGKTYTIFDGPPLNLFGSNRPHNYCIPIIHDNKIGYLTFTGRPYITQEFNGTTQTASFSLEMDTPHSEDALFQVTLFN